MKCQILFSGKNKKNIINLSSAENAQRVVKVNYIDVSGKLLGDWKTVDPVRTRVLWHLILIYTIFSGLSSYLG